MACGRKDLALRASILPTELATRIASKTALFVLDVRSPGEFASGHILGAVNVPVNELGDRLAALKLSWTDEIVVHCETGGRAHAAESLLRESGFTGVRDLTGHMAAWR